MNFRALKTAFVPPLCCLACAGFAGLAVGAGPTAWNSFQIELPPPPYAEALHPESPFGINTAFQPDTPDLAARLRAMQNAGVKWGRQDFTWSRIELAPGKYDWAPYDRLVSQCHQHGLLIMGNLVYAPKFHDPRTPAGVEAYCAFAQAAAKRYAGQVDHWQIWNEPNGGYWKGTADEYARLLAASGQTIHAANPKAKVLGLNSAFCDVRFAEAILKQVPYDCFDIACFHPYRPPSAPEDKLDWWMLDQYVKSWNKKNLTTNYFYHAYAFMTRMLEGRKWLRNDAFGPDVYACVFADEARSEDLIVAWSPKPYAYVRVTNTEQVLTFYDILGTKRFVPLDKVRTGHLPVPLGESPIYMVGAKGTKATVRPDPGW